MGRADAPWQDKPASMNPLVLPARSHKYNLLREEPRSSLHDQKVRRMHENTRPYILHNWQLLVLPDLF